MKSLRDWAESLAYAAAITAALFFVFWPLKIEGSSMQNTIMSGDRVVISRLLKYLGLDRGDIVLCRIAEGGQETQIIKRLIALPGDHIVLSDGKVYLNDELLTEDYVKEEVAYGGLDIILGASEYFVMGDNRELSYDSRMLGPIQGEDILARYLFTWYPIK